MATQTTDLDAVKAIDALMRQWPRCLPLLTLREFVARHTGRNPHIAGPLAPDADIVADLEATRAKVASLRADLEAARTRAKAAEAKAAALRTQLADAKAQIDSNATAQCNPNAQAANPPESRPDGTTATRTFDKTGYQRRLMRQRRAAKAGKAPANPSAGADAPA